MEEGAGYGITSRAKRKSTKRTVNVDLEGSRVDPSRGNARPCHDSTRVVTTCLCPLAMALWLLLAS